MLMGWRALAVVRFDRDEEEAEDGPEFIVGPLVERVGDEDGESRGRGARILNDSPTTPPGSPLSGVVERNIEALLALRQERLGRRNLQDRSIDAVTAFAGSPAFIYLHAAILVFWLVANTSHLGLRAWDPYPFVMLAMAASVEAIFVSTFVLIGQNRQSETADRRADLDLQINLLAEHEITRLIEMVEAIGRRLGAEAPVPDIDEIKRDVAPEVVARSLEEHVERHDA